MLLKKTLVKVLRSICAVALVGSIAACASNDEKQARRENAFDLSGGYRSSKALGSQVELSYEISNEAGRSDIVVNLKRLSPVTDSERDLLKRAGLDPNRALQPFSGELTLGRGRSARAEGGENISQDFGETSNFYVCTEPIRYDDEHSLRYCMNGTAKRSTRRMEGDLILSWTRTRKVPSKDDPSILVNETKSDEARLRFVTDMSQTFYRQYFGAWSGDCYVANTAIDSSFCSSLSVDKDDRTRTALVNFGGGINVIIYTGRTFALDEAASRVSIETFRTPDYPAFLSVYKAIDQSGQRLLVVGQIWSLGELTGTLVMVDNKTQSEIATFRFKKN